MGHMALAGIWGERCADMAKRYEGIQLVHNLIHRLLYIWHVSKSDLGLHAFQVTSIANLLCLQILACCA